MNKPQKQTVYLPVNDFNSSERAICTIGIPDLYGDKVVEKDGYFFTSEQLNKYTKEIIKQALETAAEKVELVPHDVDIDLESITNTFEETFKQFEV